MQFFLRNGRWVSRDEIVKLREKHSKPKITKAQIRQEKIKQLRDLGVDIKMVIPTEELEAKCQEYHIEVTEETILNNNK